MPNAPTTPPTPCLVADKDAMANLTARVTAAMAATDPIKALARVGQSLTNLYNIGAISLNVFTKIDLLIFEKEAELCDK